MSHFKIMYACGEHVESQCRCPGLGTAKVTRVGDKWCPTCPPKVNLVFHPDAFEIVYDAPGRPGAWQRFGRPDGWTEWQPL